MLYQFVQNENHDCETPILVLNLYLKQNQSRTKLPDDVKKWHKKNFYSPNTVVTGIWNKFEFY